MTTAALTEPPTRTSITRSEYIAAAFDKSKEWKLDSIIRVLKASETLFFALSLATKSAPLARLKASVNFARTGLQLSRVVKALHFIGNTSVKDTDWSSRVFFDAIGPYFFGFFAGAWPFMNNLGKWGLIRRIDIAWFTRWVGLVAGCGIASIGGLLKGFNERDVAARMRQGGCDNREIAKVEFDSIDGFLGGGRYGLEWIGGMFETFMLDSLGLDPMHKQWVRVVLQAVPRSLGLEQVWRNEHKNEIIARAA